MLRAIGRRSEISKDAMSDEPYDPWVEIMGNLKGKAEKVKILNLDLKDHVMFP
jgi:hypothetical protein